MVYYLSALIYHPLRNPSTEKRVSRFIPSRTVPRGMRRLAKIEKALKTSSKREAKRRNKNYPGEMLRLGCKRLPLLGEQTKTSPRDYWIVAIGAKSREPYAAVLPDKTAASAKYFPEQVLRECLYIIYAAPTVSALRQPPRR